MALIDQQEALDALNEYFCRISKLKRRGLNKGERAISLDVAGAIQSLPPKVICCKDCKRWDNSMDMFEVAQYCHRLEIDTRANDFCAWAEKRGEEE